MDRVSEPLTQMGARIEERGEPGRLPLHVEGGTLRGIGYDSPHASAQVKSALLLAGLCAGVPVTVREPHQSRDHTERLLRALGATVMEEEENGGWQVSLETSAGIRDVEVAIPGDFSSAAFALAACALLNRADVVIRNVGINPTRTGLLAVLARMGVNVEASDARTIAGEPRADLRAAPGGLRGTDVDEPEVPAMIDELPLVAVLAARAAGETVIRGAAELRVKETDRIRALATNLRALGVVAEELPDGLVIEGTDAPLRGQVRSWGDHRIAMAFGVLALTPGSDIRVDAPDVAEVSFPGFAAVMKQIVAA
jgi:3-phosphoshikimate 1-carboxyvinyltransferase